MPESLYEKYAEEAYKKIIYWHKNVFMVPTGASVKKFINGITRLFDQWTDTPLKSIALKTILVVPALLLQKPSRKSKHAIIFLHCVKGDRELFSKQIYIR